jgi:hypothetical protein
LGSRVALRLDGGRRRACGGQGGARAAAGHAVLFVLMAVSKPAAHSDAQPAAGGPECIGPTVGLSKPAPQRALGVVAACSPLRGRCSGSLRDRRCIRWTRSGARATYGRARTTVPFVISELPGDVPKASCFPMAALVPTAGGNDTQVAPEINARPPPLLVRPLSPWSAVSALGAPMAPREAREARGCVWGGAGG